MSFNNPSRFLWHVHALIPEWSFNAFSLLESVTPLFRQNTEVHTVVSYLAKTREKAKEKLSQLSTSKPSVLPDLLSQPLAFPPGRQSVPSFMSLQGAQDPVTLQLLVESIPLLTTCPELMSPFLLNMLLVRLPVHFSSSLWLTKLALTHVPSPDFSAPLHSKFLNGLFTVLASTSRRTLDFHNASPFLDALVLAKD